MDQGNRELGKLKDRLRTIEHVVMVPAMQSN